MQHSPLFAGAGVPAAPRPGFLDPVFDAQSVFRAVMMALAEPGTLRRLPPDVLRALAAPPPLAPAAAALLLTLADFEAPVWLDPACRAGEAGDYLTFHTGCRIVADRAEAHFAAITDATRLQDLDGFAAGSLEYPDRSTTLIVQAGALETLETLAPGSATGRATGSGADDTAGDDGRPVWRLRGPGIPAERRVAIAGLASGLLAALQANHERFPCGVDLVFVAGEAMIGLPRSTSVETETV